MRALARFRTRILGLGALTLIAVGLPTIVTADEAPDYYTDPATGIVYRKVIRTIERPVVETKMTQRKKTVYKPKTVVETRPTTLRTFMPVTEFRWVPKVEGRWNPFRQPTVAYHHVPETRWQANEQVIAQTQTKVQWEAVTQTVDVPERLTRIAREKQVDYEPVGRVAPAPTQVARRNVAPEIAARLRPLDESTAVQREAGGDAPGRTSYASREKPRTTLQSGLRATELVPGASRAYTQPLGAGGVSSVAGLAPPRLWR